MALQWACWFGVLNTARSSLHAATDVGINMPSMLNYVFDGTELSIMREERAEREGQPGYLAALDPLGMQQHTLLQLACARGNTTVAQLLVDHGARVDVEDQNRISPLGYCPNSHVVSGLDSIGV